MSSTGTGTLSTYLPLDNPTHDKLGSPFRTPGFASVSSAASKLPRGQGKHISAIFAIVLPLVFKILL